MELGNSFVVVCNFSRHGICSVSTTGWHFVSYISLNKGAFQMAKPIQGENTMYPTYCERYIENT